MSNLSPVITLKELNTVYKDLIDRINVASVYQFKGEISKVKHLRMLEDNLSSGTIEPGFIYEMHYEDNDVEKDFALALNLKPCDNIVCKKTIDANERNAIRANNGFSVDPNGNYYWGDYWTEIGSYMQLADETHNGFMSTGSQTFAGDKTFNDNVTIGNTLTVEGNGTVNTAILNVTGGVNNVNTLESDTIIVSGTTTLKSLSGPNSTLNVKNGGTTTVSSISGIPGNNNTIDYADFQVSGTVTCNNFNLGTSSLSLNADTTVNSIQKDTCILKPSGVVTCKDFTATSKNITANSDNSTVKNINNESAILKASGDITCVNFTATDFNITANKANSTVNSVNTTDGVLTIGSGGLSCKTFIATDKTITATGANSTIKNISSTTATLNDVTSISCNELALGTKKLTVNDATTFSSIATSPTLSMNGTLSCGDVTLDNSGTKQGLTVNSATTVASISGTPSLTTSGNISCADVSLGTKNLTVNSATTVASISGTPSLTTSGNISCVDFINSSYNITSNADTEFSNIITGASSVLNTSGTIYCNDFNNTSGTVKSTSTGTTTFSNITGNGSVNVSGTLYAGTLKINENTSSTVSAGGVTLGSGTSTIPITYNAATSGQTDTNVLGYSKYVKIGNGTNAERGDLSVNGHIFASSVHNAVWNDLVDCIPVNEDAELEYGYCYSFDGSKYIKSNKHCDSQYIGIHSDTSGMRMGERPCKTLDVAISGFVLAYVDKYKTGTPLVCGKNGRLEKANFFDKIFRPYRIVATYWKDENEEEYGPNSRKVKVNNRNWVKIR